MELSSNDSELDISPELLHQPVDLPIESVIDSSACQPDDQIMSDVLLAPDPFKGTSIEDASDFLDRLNILLSIRN